MATIKEEQIRALPGWQPHGDGISRTFHFDDFGVATRFVGRTSTPRSPVASRSSASAAARDRDRRHLDGATPTPDDVAVARRIQRLLGDHRHPVGRAGP